MGAVKGPAMRAHEQVEGQQLTGSVCVAVDMFG